MSMTNFLEDLFNYAEHDEPVDIAALIAEERIKEAIKNGEFDNLSCKGKPLEFENTTFIPREKHMAYKVLKNGGFLPPEMELKKEIYLLENQLKNCSDDAAKRELMNKLNEKKTKCSMLMEKSGKE